MNLDIIQGVEACYAPAASDDAWLGGILDALSALDPGRLGLVAEIFRVAPGGQRVECAIVGRPAIPSGFMEQRDRVFPPGMLDPSEPVVLAMRRAAALGDTRELARMFEHFGGVDGLGIFAIDPDGRVVSIGAPVLAGHPFAPRTLHQLKLFSAHLAAAARLRHATSARRPGDTAEAVLDGAGKVVDATGDATTARARTTLAEAVRRMDHARGPLRRTDPDEALQLWEGLVDGTWSLVDRCDADGKRYVLARRNRPGVRDPKALTPRERFVLAFAAMGHQNKFIGYELGFSPSAVAGHLRAARRKLGVASRAELVRMFAALVRP